MNTRINPHWLKSLAIQTAILIFATFIGLVVIGNKEVSGMLFQTLWIALASPLAYPIAGPYMVAFCLATHTEGLALFFWPVVVLSYVAYFAFFFGAILHKDRNARIGFCVVLAAWFVLALVGSSDWTMFWSV